MHGIQVGESPLSKHGGCSAPTGVCAGELEASVAVDKNARYSGGESPLSKQGGRSAQTRVCAGELEEDVAVEKNARYSGSESPMSKQGGSSAPTRVCAGELGAGVAVDKRHLSEEQRQRLEAGQKQHAFNEFVSDLISLHRSLPPRLNEQE